jgi:EpsI family protein
MLPVLILLGVLSACGPQVTRTIAVPVGFLYFAMPAWNLLAWPLQSLTLWIVRVAAPVIGVPATVSGSLIALPDDMKFKVALVCSGAGFLAQGLAVAALLGELEQARVGRRLRLLGAMAMLAIVTNWLRVLVLVHVGYSTGMRHVLVTRHHLLFGYVLFVLTLVVFVWIAASQRSFSTPQAAPTALRSSAHGGGDYLWAAIALAAPPLAAVALAAASDRVSARALDLPAGRADWNGPLAAVDETWRPLFVGLHDEARGLYRDLSGHTVEVVVIGYSAQAQDRELVNEGNSLVGSGALTLLRSDRTEGLGRPLHEDVTADTEGHRSLIWSFYAIAGRPFVTPVWAQLWYGLHAFGTPPYSALFAFRTSCAPSCAAARAVLASFTQAMRPEALAAGTRGPLPAQDMLPAVLAARPERH